MALAAIYVGATRSDAAKIGGAELQIIWERVFALQGLRAPDGLLNGNAPGQRGWRCEYSRTMIQPWLRYCGALTKYRNTLLEIINFPTIDFIVVLSKLRIIGR